MTKKGTRLCALSTCKKRFKALSNHHYFCSAECVTAKGCENSEKIKAKLKAKVWTEKKSEQRKKDIEAKNKVTNWKIKTRNKCQEIARLIDFDLPCLARNYKAKQLHGGHVYAKGGNSSMAFNLHNIHRQSAQSNHFQNDDGLLREGVVREYGQAYMDFISDLRITPQLTLNNLEYHFKYKDACRIANALKKNLKRLNAIQRIGLRNEVNIELGIYSEELSIYSI